MVESTLIDIFGSIWNDIRSVLLATGGCGLEQKLAIELLQSVQIVQLTRTTWGTCIHSKSKKVCGFCFPISKNLRKTAKISDNPCGENSNVSADFGLLQLQLLECMGSSYLDGRYQACFDLLVVFSFDLSYTLGLYEWKLLYQYQKGLGLGVPMGLTQCAEVGT